jgi:probable rRNA maturation factor
MKLRINLQDTRIKNKTSKGKVVFNLTEIASLEDVFTKFLNKNPHFKQVQQVTINVTLCGKVKIKNLNKEYRSKNNITDVLSFGVHENLRLDLKTKQYLESFVDLGDIFICREVALSQSREFEINYQQEVLHLLAHGFLHLLGYDHELSKKEEKIMESLEEKMVKSIFKKLGY